LTSDFYIVVIVNVQLAGSSLSDLRPTDTGRRCKVKTRHASIMLRLLHSTGIGLTIEVTSQQSLLVERQTDTPVLVLVIQVLVNITDKILRSPQKSLAIFSQ